MLLHLAENHVKWKKETKGSMIMKDITVLDILNLPIMANAELKAGQSGLSNIVSYVKDVYKRQRRI